MMPEFDVLVSSPFPIDSLQGNSISALRIEHFGAALEPDLRVEAERWMLREPRYHWAEPLPRDQVAATISASHATINSGRTEGGSNAICESIVLGTPVLATEITANIGFLGADYAGFYPLGDAAALSALLVRCAAPGSTLLTTLSIQIKQRAPLFRPDSESADWGALLASLGKLD